MAFLALLLPDIVIFPQVSIPEPGGLPFPFAVEGVMASLLAALVVAYPISAIWHRRRDAMSRPVFTVLLLGACLVSVFGAIGPSLKERASGVVQSAISEHAAAARGEFLARQAAQMRVHDLALELLNNLSHESTSLLKADLVPSDTGSPISGNEVDWQRITATRDGVRTEAPKVKMLPSQLHSLFNGTISKICQSDLPSNDREILAAQVLSHQPKVDASAKEFSIALTEGDAATCRLCDFLLMHQGDITAVDGNLHFDSDEILAQLKQLQKTTVQTISKAKTPDQFNDEINGILSDILTCFERDRLSGKPCRPGSDLVAVLKTEADDLAAHGQSDSAIVKYNEVITEVQDFPDVDAKIVESIRASANALQAEVDKQHAAAALQDQRLAPTATPQASASPTTNSAAIMPAPPIVTSAAPAIIVDKSKPIQIQPLTKRAILLVFSPGMAESEIDAAEAACKKYGLDYQVSNQSFDPELVDYTAYGAVLGGSNTMYSWDGQSSAAFDHLDAFMKNGGHLILFGAFNGKGMQILNRYGVQTGGNHSSGPFRAVPGITDLLIQGNEDMIPESHFLRCTGNLSCTTDHQVLLWSNPRTGQDAPLGGDPAVLTLGVGKGRLTVSTVEPHWETDSPGGHNANWLMTAVISWISRGCPEPPSDAAQAGGGK